jgi:hypothetical protein
MFRKKEAKKVTCVLPPYNNRFNTDSAWPSRPLLGSVLDFGRTAKVAPEPPSARPFQAGQKGATASRVNRALYGRKIRVRYDLEREGVY